MAMQIIEGPEVDLISPFPSNQIHRVYGWMQCVRNLTSHDFGPKTKEDFDKMAQQYIDTMLTFGIIDKENKLHLQHPAPLVGVLAFEMSVPTIAGMHFASTRKAWGTRIIDQAIQVAINKLFESSGYLLRVNALINEKNIPAYTFLRRNGFDKEAVLRDMVLVGGIPVNMTQMVALRSHWHFNPQPLKLRKEN